jgi:hypothetical protein
MDKPKMPKTTGVPLRDLLRDVPSRNFALPGWMDEEKIVHIIDALNRGGGDESDSSDEDE